MKRLLGFVVILAASVSVQAAAITTELVRINTTSTNRMIFIFDFDVYNIIATNPNDAPATSLELDLDSPVV